ncbi:hypothetical protein [Aureimonas psammosilenae]|uniref:hypothetical protein n=1 Tax=Aureimonas psammosilenae TaxID=2495496 RepID=UPI001260D96E|nr:hypothetical protein [Aureimonas psammosilenae]
MLAFAHPVPRAASSMASAMRHPRFVAAAVHSLRQQADRARARHHDSEVEAINLQIEKLLENEDER